jgi:hypothetical protein
VLQVLDDGVRAGEAKPGVPVVEAHEVGRRAVGPVDFGDLAGVFRLAYDLAVHVQSVADRCLHGAHLLISAIHRRGSGAQEPYTRRGGGNPP